MPRIELTPSKLETFGDGAPWFEYSTVFMVDSQISETLAASGFDQEIPYNAEINEASIQAERQSKAPHLARLFFLLNHQEIKELTPEILNDPALKACLVVENQKKFNQVDLQKISVLVEYTLPAQPAFRRSLLGVGF